MSFFFFLTAIYVINKLENLEGKRGEKNQLFSGLLFLYLVDFILIF